jgi:hypothetical protein
VSQPGEPPAARSPRTGGRHEHGTSTRTSDDDRRTDARGRRADHARRPDRPARRPGRGCRVIATRG